MTKEEIKKYHLEYYKRPEIIEKVRQYKLEYYKRPEVIANIKEYKQKNKKRIKEYRLEYNKRPENVKKRKEYRLEYNKSYNAKNSVCKNRYNITLNEIEKKRLLQKNVCIICKKNKELVIDHCHKTGKFRGLLCKNCNLGLGFLKDDIKILNNAIKYLIK